MTRHPSKRSRRRSYDWPANFCGLCRRWPVNRRQSGQHIDRLCQFRHSSTMKDVRWHGSSRSDVEAFPADARREAGYQLFQVQIGEAPSDWKPMTSIGPGVREIRIRQASGAYRVIYLPPSAMLFTSCTRSRRRPKQRPCGTSTSPGHGSDRSGDHDGKVCISRPVPGRRSGRA